MGEGSTTLEHLQTANFRRTVLLQIVTSLTPRVCCAISLPEQKLLYEFHASQHSSRIAEALEPEHRSDPSLDTPVVLFDHVVKIRASADLDSAFPPIIEFVIHTHAAQSGMGWFESVEGNHTRIAVTTKRSTKEGFGSRDVACSTKVGFYGFALFIDGAVEVHPSTAYLEVGLVYAPGITTVRS
jgi:hypothetical protein